MENAIYTKDHHRIAVGDWLSDTDGMYMVLEIDRFVKLAELEVDENGDYNKIGERILLPVEVKHLSYT